ncbi:MAG: putative porin [Bacteroides sp.]
MRIRQLTYLLLFLLCSLSTAAQNRMPTRTRMGNNDRDQFGNQIDPSTRPDNLEDSTHTEIQSLAPKLYQWQLSETLGDRTIVSADTLSLNFQNSNLVDGMMGHYNYLGNLGSPRLSRLFFERRDKWNNIFLNPLDSYLVRPDEFKFTNSNVPYTNLSYYKAGDKLNGEERFKSYFSVNANKRMAFGFNIDYLYGRGFYANQSTSYFNSGLFASYIGERYQMQAIYNHYFMKMNENGGITDDQYITHPENMAEGKKQYEASNIPVNLEQTGNRNHVSYLYLTQRYRLGFNKEQLDIKERKTPDGEVKNDTTRREEFVPVTSFIHTFQLERVNHKFRANNEPSDFYPHAYLDPKSSRDSTLAFSVKNTFGIALLEGFNKYAKAGLTAYASHKMSRYDLMNVDTATLMPRQRYTENEVYIGGELAKREGNLLHYNVNGEVGVAGKAAGQFRVKGAMDLNFRLWKDTVNLIARATVSNTLPSFYLRHYHSNHFSWDNEDMDKEMRTRLEGELNIARWGTNIKAGVENVKNYTYLGSDAYPTQYTGNVQVMSATLTQNFKFGIFHLDNEVTWQKSSEEDILPLPDLSLYHNFYLLTKVAKKVLTVQLGADVRYFTSYYAPAYQPATQQFHLQREDDRVEIGNYPIVNVYANLHLKRTRIFVMMSHVNAGMGQPNYFLSPHYPINQRVLKIGLSWNFYD